MSSVPLKVFVAGGRGEKSLSLGTISCDHVMLPYETTPGVLTGLSFSSEMSQVEGTAG